MVVSWLKKQTRSIAMTSVARCPGLAVHCPGSNELKVVQRRDTRQGHLWQNRWLDRNSEVATARFGVG